MLVAPAFSRDCPHAYLDLFRPPENVVCVGESHSFQQPPRIVVVDTVPSDDHWQVEGFEAMREYSEQCLLAQTLSPSGTHEIHTDLDCLRILGPRSQTSTARKLSRLPQE